MCLVNGKYIEINHHKMLKPDKRLFLNVILLVNLVSLSAQHPQHLNQQKISQDLYYTLVQDSVYMITHYFPYWGGNSMFVLLPWNKGVLIDTPFESVGTLDLLEWINKNFGELELSVIVTGFHQDNLGGNEVLIGRDIPVYGPDLTKELVETRGDELKQIMLSSVEEQEDHRYYESYEKLRLMPPNHLFPIQEGLKLTIGNEIFEVYFPGESHTADNTVVYLHHRKILFGGCMIKGTEYNSPGYIKHANMQEWPESVKRVIEKFPGCEVVIPGHGSEGSRELLFHTVEILENWNQKKR